MAGHPKVCAFLREHGAELQLDEINASTQLMEMTRAGDIERVLQLLHGGCAADAVDHELRSCLHLAATTGSTSVVKALLEAGANINIKDRQGRTPLADCIREGHRELALMLIEAGGGLEYDEATAAGELCELARCGDVEKMRLILDGKSDPNAADYDKRTCLHLAAFRSWVTHGGSTIRPLFARHAWYRPVFLRRC